jgi:TolB-like protein/Tfp pilus assembly protein PilF
MSFFEELKRRNVVRVGVAYGIASWVLLQVADLVLENIEAPPWVIQALMLVVVLGFVAALVIAWAYEMTPEGIKKESEVDRSQSIVGQTGKKLDRIIIGFLIVAVAVLLVERKMLKRETSPDPAAQVQTAANAAAENPGNEPSIAATDADPGNSGSVAPARNAIAVLPFANRSLQEGDLFFTDGIHDDLLTQLAKIDNLKVISRTSVMEYRDTTKKIPEIAAELGVGKILEGGVQRAGNRVRINAQLIDVATDEHLWAETFDREMTIDNIFNIQSEITRQIVTAIKGEISDEDSRSITEAPTDNVAAYEAYLRARAATLRGDYTQENYIEAEPWAKSAVELDPEFAEAWALLVEIHGQANWLGYDRSPERRTMAEHALRKATSLKPESANVIAAEAEFFYRFDGDYNKALEHFAQAHAAAPGDSRILTFMAITQRRTGRWEESLESFEQTLELDPSNTFNITQYIGTLSIMGRWDRVRAITEAYTVRFPGSRDLRSHQMQSRIFADGDLEAARELFEQMPAWVGSEYAYPVINLIRFQRDWDTLLQLLDKPEVAGFITQSSGEGIRLYFMAEAHLGQGQVETARNLLQQALDSFYAMESSSDQQNGFRWQAIANALALQGETDRALAASERALDYMSSEDDAIFGAFNEASYTRILAMAGQREEALESLRDQLGQPGGFNRWQLHFDPNWDFFRDDPRFVALATPPGEEPNTP